MFIFDLDNTLFDAEHRSHLAREKRWEEFHARAVEDEPVAGILAIYKTLAVYHRMVILTGRTEAWREMTINNLKKHWINPEEMIMRPDGDFRSDVDFKLSALQLCKPGEHVTAIFEDRDTVVKALRTAGYTVLQVRESLY